MNTFNVELDQSSEEQSVALRAGYEAPRIESVLTHEDLEREVAYAGIQAPSGAQLA